MASAYVKEGRFDEGERLARETTETQRRVLGDEHPDTLSSMDNLQGLYSSQKRDEDALPIALKVLETRRRVLGDMHPSTCNTRLAPGAMYCSQRRYAEAEPLLLAAHDGYARALGSEHPDTRHVVGELVALNGEWGKLDKAAEWRKRLPPSK